MRPIAVKLQTIGGFSPFDDVIETVGATHFPINAGTTERYDDLAKIDVADGGGEPTMSIFVGQPFEFPSN